MVANATVPPFSVSFGIATSEPGMTFSQTLEGADQALLCAKRTGRDRIVIAGAGGASEEGTPAATADR